MEPITCGALPASRCSLSEGAAIKKREQKYNFSSQYIEEMNYKTVDTGLGKNLKNF